MKTYTIQLLEKKRLTDNVFEFCFSKPPKFLYTAGQFVQFLIDADGKPIRRAYSLCSIPTEMYLTFCVKLKEGGAASGYFAQLEVGSQSLVTPAIGHFVYTPTNRDLALIATGVGLSPIFGIIREALGERSDNNVFLLHGVRAEKDIFWLEKLDRLKEKYQNFDYAVTLSAPEPHWAGCVGRVTEHLGGAEVDNEYYICGNPFMVRDTKKLLEAQGVGADRIHFEMF